MAKVLTKEQEKEILEMEKFFSQIPKRKRDYIRGYLAASVDTSKEFAKQSVARARDGNKGA